MTRTKFAHPFNPVRNHHSQHEQFMTALHGKHRIDLSFLSQEDHGFLLRSCAPMDFGPSRRARDGSNRYHFWDFDSDTEQHTLSLVASQIRSMNVSAQAFSPEEFVNWPTDWFTQRNWGGFS